MIIETIDVRHYSTSHSACTEDRLFHKKSLPFLSVVQALEGSYGIGIDSSEEQSTGTLGAFIAPSGRQQHITHYIDEKSGVMRSHWIFLDIIINRMYRIDDVYNFPVLLPPQYNQTVHDIIAGIESNNDLCDNLSDIYRLIKILLAAGTPKSEIDPQMNEIRNYINQHYPEKILPGQLAGHFTLSVPSLYRKFRKNQGLTPANYINEVRLTQAALLLETTDRPIGDICEAVGITDAFYFSKLFKQKYGMAPIHYRRQVTFIK